MGFSMVWTLSATYTRDVLGISEARYGWLPATNALMVISLQLLFTMYAKRFSLLKAMAIGCGVYVLSIASFSIAQNFWWIWGAFVVLTCGEMFFVPSSTTYVAKLAPADMRGRYMSLFSLHWPIASGLGPLVGGLINDTIGPRWIWVVAAIFPLIASIGYARMDRQQTQAAILEEEYA
jgi:MFS family permease